MVIQFTRRLLLLELLFAVLISAGVIFWSHLPLALSCLSGFIAVLMSRMSLTANNFFFAWRYGSATPATHRLTIFQACALYFYEFYAAMWTTSWAMPFHTFSKRTMPQANGLPVLLVHGYGCNSGYWHALSKALLHADIAHYAIDLEPMLGDIDSYVPSIHQAIESWCQETGHSQVIVVAHSMGGLVMRAYMRDYGCRRIAQVITLGAPHHGTCMANFGIGINSKQMARHGQPSDWLNQLAAGEDSTVYKRIVSIYSHHDNIVAPQTSSHLEGSRNIEYQGIGHVALAIHPLIHARIIAEIRNASARAIKNPRK